MSDELYSGYLSGGYNGVEYGIDEYSSSADNPQDPYWDFLKRTSHEDEAPVSPTQPSWHNHDPFHKPMIEANDPFWHGELPPCESDFSGQEEEEKGEEEQVSNVTQDNQQVSGGEHELGYSSPNGVSDEWFPPSAPSHSHTFLDSSSYFVPKTYMDQLKISPGPFNKASPQNFALPQSPDFRKRLSGTYLGLLPESKPYGATHSEVYPHIDHRPPRQCEVRKFNPTAPVYNTSSVAKDFSLSQVLGSAYSPTAPIDYSQALRSPGPLQMNELSRLSISYSANAEQPFKLVRDQSWNEMPKRK
ncbi:hypothetical protein DFH27DRAFT_605642 [Peziza echinospora]|nr:hypothetical protein DFH27DRAFT_605642 [Peziza echinospora]